MPLEHADADPLMPYQLKNPPDALAEIVVPKAIPDDERLWVEVVIAAKKSQETQMEMH